MSVFSLFGMMGGLLFAPLIGQALLQRGAAWLQDRHAGRR